MAKIIEMDAWRLEVNHLRARVTGTGPHTTGVVRQTGLYVPSHPDKVLWDGPLPTYVKKRVLTEMRRQRTAEGAPV